MLHVITRWALNLSVQRGHLQVIIRRVEYAYMLEKGVGDSSVIKTFFPVVSVKMIERKKSHSDSMPETKYWIKLSVKNPLPSTEVTEPKI